MAATRPNDAPSRQMDHYYLSVGKQKAFAANKVGALKNMLTNYINSKANEVDLKKLGVEAVTLNKAKEITDIQISTDLKKQLNPGLIKLEVESTKNLAIGNVKISLLALRYIESAEKEFLESLKDDAPPNKVALQKFFDDIESRIATVSTTSTALEKIVGEKDDLSTTLAKMQRSCQQYQEELKRDYDQQIYVARVSKKWDEKHARSFKYGSSGAWWTALKIAGYTVGIPIAVGGVVVVAAAALFLADGGGIGGTPGISPSLEVLARAADGAPSQSSTRKEAQTAPSKTPALRTKMYTAEEDIAGKDILGRFRGNAFIPNDDKLAENVAKIDKMLQEKKLIPYQITQSNQGISFIFLEPNPHISYAGPRSINEFLAPPASKGEKKKTEEMVDIFICEGGRPPAHTYAYGTDHMLKDRKTKNPHGHIVFGHSLKEALDFNAESFPDRFHPVAGHRRNHAWESEQLAAVEKHYRLSVAPSTSTHPSTMFGAKAPTPSAPSLNTTPASSSKKHENKR